MNNIIVNGKIFAADEPTLLAANRSYRYGDGLFETIKVLDGKILLEKYHFERLFSGLSLLEFEIPTLFNPAKIQQDILHLCKRNECERLARVRLSVFRGNGGLYDDDKDPGYIIECWPLNESVNKLNENGLIIGVYTGARKSCDTFSNLKSANFLPYTMAALFVKQNKWNDCLVLNSNNHIADSTIANIFIIRGNQVITPSLNEGCVNGVMRRHIIQQLQLSGIDVLEQTVLITDIESADEVFLSNAINGIRWVKQFGNTGYRNEQTVKIYHDIAQTFTG